MSKIILKIVGVCAGLIGGGLFLHDRIKKNRERDAKALAEWADNYGKEKAQEMMGPIKERYERSKVAPDKTEG